MRLQHDSYISEPCFFIYTDRRLKDIGEEEFHLAFCTDDYDAAHALHEEMGCICFENPAMGLYFIKDRDGYWLEIVPKR